MLFRCFKGSPSAYETFRDLWEGEFETKGGRPLELECSVYAVEADAWLELCVARMLKLRNGPPRFIGGVDLDNARGRPTEQHDPDDPHEFDYQQWHYVLAFRDEAALRTFVQHLLEDISSKVTPVFEHDPNTHEKVSSVLERKREDPAWKKALEDLEGSSNGKKWRKLK